MLGTDGAIPGLPMGPRAADPRGLTQATTSQHHTKVALTRPNMDADENRPNKIRRQTSVVAPFTLDLADKAARDVRVAGGKAASLAELQTALAGSGAVFPTGFVVTTAAYRSFLDASGVRDEIGRILQERDAGRIDLAAASRTIRRLVRRTRFPRTTARAITEAYEQLAAARAEGELEVAVRSSATAEDAPTASFAGQHSSFLGVRGARELVRACRDCYASLFTERAMTYRERFGFRHETVELAIAVHTMVAWPECRAAGVMFTLDTETGFRGVVTIEASVGLGEAVVKGIATPDQFLIFKAAVDRAPRPVIAATRGAKRRKIVPAARARRTRTVRTEPSEQDAFAISEDEAVRLARIAMRLEAFYGHPIDVEWAIDGKTGSIAIVPARPETVESAREATTSQQFVLDDAPPEPLVSGLSVGQAVGAGPARVLRKLIPARDFPASAVLVAPATTPDWLPLMRKASAIVTDHGGRTSHAAIVSRELGVPAVVGAEDATAVIEDGQLLTVSCCEGRSGKVYPGVLRFHALEAQVAPLQSLRTHVMLNLGVPDAAFRWWRLPVDGIGLARTEFIIGTGIRAHPMALLHPERIESSRERRLLESLVREADSPAEYFVENLAKGIARLAASQYPRPVIVRLSDFKSNEYAGLVAGRWFEPHEENPMLGLRGASRYYNERYVEAFALECQAFRRAREEMGFDNVVIMVPFCRTAGEADRVLDELRTNGLERGRNGLKLYLMCEIPSNVIEAAEFARRFDGFSIGSNDLTQLVLGIDRDSAELKGLFDERDPAVKKMIRDVITTAHEHGTVVGICGQAPSDYPDFAAFLVECGIDSISVNPDAVLRTREVVAQAEAQLR